MQLSDVIVTVTLLTSRWIRRKIKSNVTTKTVPWRQINISAFIWTTEMVHLSKCTESDQEIKGNTIEIGALLFNAMILIKVGEEARHSN